MDIKIDENTAIVCIFATAVAGICYFFNKLNEVVK